MKLLPAALLIVLGMMHVLPDSLGTIFTMQVGPITADQFVGLVAVIIGLLVFFQMGRKKAA